MTSDLRIPSVRASRRASWLLLLTFALGLAVPVPGRAADAARAANDRAGYPERAVRIVVPFAPGSAVDILPRLVAEQLSMRWGQPVIVENRPGAAGNIGAEAVARAAPDGYTLLASPAPPLVINQYLYPKLAFDPARFEAITVLAAAPNVVVVHPKRGIDSLDALIAFAKAHPDALSYASPGAGTTPNLTMEWMKAAAGIRVVHVPYKGGAPAIADLLAGHVDAMVANLGDVLPHVRAGRLNVVAVGGAGRAPELPDTPALAERYPELVSTAWYALVAPPGTPAPVVERIATAVVDALRSDAVRAGLRDHTAIPVGGTPAATGAFMRGEGERWRKVIVDAGIVLE
jgi:tripartite-type tricarboxylate transporter receptor subunit TctC